MLYEEIRPKQDLSYISSCSLSILYNSKFILMAMSLGTNAVVETMVHCICLMVCFLMLKLILYTNSEDISGHGTCSLPRQNLNHVCT